MQRVRVKAIIYLEVDIPDDADPVFVIEENNCPGTGPVGHALYKLMEEAAESDICVFCRDQCENVIDRILNKDKPSDG